MKADKIKGLDGQELKQQAREIEEQVFRIRFQMSMGQTEGIKKLRHSKKDLARILTELRERELKAAKG
jgi:large subunit ribosomal protein L29